MEIVPSNGRRGQVPRGALALTPDAIRAVIKLGNMAANWASSGPASAGPNVKMPNMPQPKRKKSRKQRTKQGPQVRTGIGGGLGPNISDVTIRGVVTMGNTSANKLTYAWALSCYTTRTDIGAISGVLTQMGVLASIYREYDLQRMQVWFEGDQPVQTAGGSIAFSIDEDPGAPTPANYAPVTNNTVSTLVPVTSTGYIDYRPPKGRPAARYCLSQGAKPEDDLSFGVIRVMSNNTSTSGANLGQLLFEATIRFHGMY